METISERTYQRAKYACFITGISTSVTGNLSPLLFLTFRSLYGISFSLLGLLVLINFVTQLAVDLIYSFLAGKFNLAKSVKLTPVVIFAGLIVYSIFPLLLPEYAYAGLVIGTIIFSAGSGLSEVLTSPVISAIPSKNPERLLSKLHSCYAWGVLFIVSFSTVFLYLFGSDRWYIVPLILSAIPICASLLFAGAKIPDLSGTDKPSETANLFSNKALILCVLCIFLGGASECTMAQWCSSYIEKALGIEKLWGDLLGVALFGGMLGLGRSLYGYFGKNILKVLLFGSAGASVCYITAVVSSNAILGLAACALTGLCVSMLWPGSLMVVSDRCPDGGVSVYALMAAGGDSGASLVPQIVGLITDFVIASPALVKFGESLSLSPEQTGMKVGMAFASLFPIFTFIVVSILIKTGKKVKTNK